MNNQSSSYRSYLFLLMAISFLVRGWLAGIMELGNDEVYYRLYALYPDWSHFDHPLMVGWVIQLFSLNLWLTSEFFLRLGSVILGTINLWFIFRIGSHLRDQRTGFIAALLYTASLYGTVITGIFILPDTPQSFFWLWALWLMIRTLPGCPRQYVNRVNMLKLGIILGLGILSKYTSVFLWLGSMLFVLIYNRHWLRSRYLYYAMGLTAVLMLPLLIWNWQNDFISFTFHTSRVEVSGHRIRPDYFLTELLGEFLYNNPMVMVMTLIAVVQFIRHRIDTGNKPLWVLFWTAIPMIMVFWAASLFRSTLPHWTAPAYNTLLPLTALWLSVTFTKHQVPRAVWISVALLMMIIVVAVGQVKEGWIPLDGPHKESQLTESNDPSLDMFGYEQTGTLFKELVANDRQSGLMDHDAFLTGTNWFPLANFDYYAASPIGMQTLAIGPLDQIHKYAWINQIEGGFTPGRDAYYLTDNRAFRSPEPELSSYFDTILPPDTLILYRGGKPAKQVFVYRLKGLKTIPADPLRQ